MEDHRWAELCPNVVTMVDIFKARVYFEGDETFQRDLEATNKVLFDIHDLYKQRINQGYLDLSEEVEKHIWDLRHQSPPFPLTFLGTSGPAPIRTPCSSSSRDAGCGPPGTTSAKSTR